MQFNRVFWVAVIMAVLIFNTGLGAALEDSPEDIGEGSGGGGLKLTTGTFSEGLSWDLVAPIMPVAVLIIAFFAFLYGLSLIVGIFASGIKTNAGTVLKSNDLRNEGQKGYLHIIGGAVLMAVSFIVAFVIWNNYGMGAW
jgi:hypothetical protein